jgi:hypothetical protein
MEETIRVALEGAKLMMKDVMFKDARSFTDIFKKGRVIGLEDDARGRRYHSWPLVEGGHCHLMRFCSVKMNDGEHINLDVEPHDIVLANINKAMLMSKDYQIYFEIIVRADNTGLVIAKYDRILGDRWIAFIDADTIPEMGELSATDTSARGTRPFTAKADELIQKLLYRLGQIYGTPEWPKPGKYKGIERSLFVDNLVKVGLPFGKDGKEHVWVEVIKEIDERGNELAGKLVNQPEQSTGFNNGDDVGLQVDEIEDVLSPKGWATNTSKDYVDARGPDKIHIFTRELEMNVSYEEAMRAWFGMSDREKEWLWRIAERRSQTIQKETDENG